MRRGLQAVLLTFALALAAPAAAQQGDAPHKPLRSGIVLTKKPVLTDHAAPAEAGEHGEPTEHAGQTGEHGGDHHGPGPINWTDFDNKEQRPYLALFINFAILVGIYVYFGRRPLAASLKKRRDDIAKEIEDAQRIRREAEARALVYQAKLAGLEQELAQARASLVDAGTGERDRIVREAEERAQRMSKEALLLLEQELAQMKQDLVRETVLAAIKAAEEVLRTSVTQSDQERLAEELLRDLGRPLGSRGEAARGVSRGAASS